MKPVTYVTNTSHAGLCILYHHNVKNKKIERYIPLMNTLQYTL